MTASQLISDLRTAGVELRVDEDRLQYRPRSAIDDRLQKELVAHRLELLAVLTRRTMASQVTGIVWDPLGGVRVESPPDLREAALELAADRGHPPLSLAGVQIEAGCSAWSRFASVACIGAVAEALLILDDLPAGAGS